jgi:glycosyltransferase involved in cell wall biosynthesis
MAAAMARVLNEPELAAQLKQAGPIQAARFTWDDMAVRLMALYQKILGQYAHLS